MVFKKTHVFLFLYSFYSFAADAELPKSEAIITLYNAARDRQAVRAIIEETADTLMIFPMPIDEVMKAIESPNYKTKVVLLEGKVVGFINYVDCTRTFLTFLVSNRYLINSFALAKDAQGKGYGSQLFSSVLDEIEASQSVVDVFLFVKSSNEIARNLYAKSGFVLDAEIPDICIMSKKMATSTDKLPKGNLIQRYPKTSLALAAVAYCAYKYYPRSPSLCELVPN